MADTYSTLLGGMGGGDDAGGMSSLLGDYAAIKNGSYGKMLKTYYAKLEKQEAEEFRRVLFRSKPTPKKPVKLRTALPLLQQNHFTAPLPRSGLSTMTTAARRISTKLQTLSPPLSRITTV